MDSELPKADKKSDNLILVTGLLRSGTTWTGKTIASIKGIKYVNEPLNVDRQRKKCPIAVSFPYIDEKTSINYQNIVITYLRGIMDSPTFYFRDQIRLALRYKAYKRLFHLLWEKKNIYGRPLLKDPMAVLCSEWIYNNFNAKVVIVMRNPFAFIASLKTAGWSISFHDLLSQKNIFSEFFFDYLPQIKEYAERPPDLIDQGIFIWNILHARYLYYNEKYKGKWYFVKHEDLSKHPVEEFSKLFQFLEIEMTNRIRKTIIKSTNGKKVNRLSRDSKKNLHTWKNRLTENEITRINEGTFDIRIKFYNDNEIEVIPNFI